MNETTRENGATAGPLIFTVPACGFLVVLYVDWLERATGWAASDNIPWNTQENADQPFGCPVHREDVLREFDRDTLQVAVGLLGILLLAALLFVVLFPERHTMTAGFSERASQAKSGSSPAENAATLFRNTVP